MLDFMMISTRVTSKGGIEIYPKFIVTKSSDLMIRGGDFYAIWLADSLKWSTDEHDAVKLIDYHLREYYESRKNEYGPSVRVLYLWDAESGMIDVWHRYCQKQMRDWFCMLDEKLIFSNTETSKKDYSSKRLDYPLEKLEMSGYDKLISTLYSKEERHKIEWAIGSIITGDSKHIQKFMVLYGSGGTGKSTILNIIMMLFDGYHSVFDAKALGSSGNSFALEAFKSNPLVAIQHDGDLSKIEDNTRLNSLVSHEIMTVNEKFKSSYSNNFKCFLFMGTNKPVKITDARSGIIRRLIDVAPSGNKLPTLEYNRIMQNIKFELGTIASHCRDVYLKDTGYYDNYIPLTMMTASNDFYNYILDNYHLFEKGDSVTLKVAWELYKLYCEEAKVSYPFSQRVFKEELRNYFKEYKERATTPDGHRLRSVYYKFKKDIFEDTNDDQENTESETFINLEIQPSIFDTIGSKYVSQYANSEGTPLYKWSSVKTLLQDLDTSKLHFVHLANNHIVIDFDLKDSDGNKSLELNIKEASKWPATYAEISKGGNGIHLHYYYEGDISSLSKLYSEDIEIKLPIGNSALRRKLTKCNNIPIATINSGLPTIEKGEKKMINFEAVKSEKGLRALIQRNLQKEIHSSTKSSIDFIDKILEDAFNSGLCYDVTDLRNKILVFAMGSSHQSDYCMKLIPNMKFKSCEPSSNINNEDAPIVFFDVEIFPNLCVLVWKIIGEENPIMRMINPSSNDIENLLKYRLIGFNNRKYDNHILYAILLGYSNIQLYKLSQRIINENKGLFSEAYNISYTDIYDFTTDKKSLKKYGIELGLHHDELGLDWDKEVPKELWEKVADYCENDVVITEATFRHRHHDFIARQMLSKISNMTNNDPTNELTKKIIFGSNKKPQGAFNYRFMGDTNKATKRLKDVGFNLDYDDEFSVFDDFGRPIFPGYKYEFGKSYYRGEIIGEGGYVYAEPGVYGNVFLLDVASMHPTSIVKENLFGDIYTEAFKSLLDARIYIKHGEFEKAKTILNGVLAEYLDDPTMAKTLSTALKIPINSVYGLTAASFENQFRDSRNVDNIVAKRGALFMVNLKYAVQSKGYTVAHIKTDSIKIPDADDEILEFVMEYGRAYGYTFEHEETYDKMCLVNDSVYVSKSNGTWHATGSQFAVPYVFKTLFSKEEICFEDLCETKSVSGSAIYLDMNERLKDVTEYENIKKHRESVSKQQKITQKAMRLLEDWSDISDEELNSMIEEGHNYTFIGRVGQFCPIEPGCDGGVMYRKKDDKYYSVTGTSNFRWLESEMVKNLNLQHDIDLSYYEILLEKSKTSISTYADLDWFLSDKPYVKTDNFIYPF